MTNTKKTKKILTRELVLLKQKKINQEKVVYELEKKKVHAQQYYDDGVSKLNDIKDSIKKIKQDKDKA